MKFSTVDTFLAIAKFKSQKEMNEHLDEFSNAIEGTIVNRKGHNFAIASLKNKKKFEKIFPITTEKYFIASVEGDALTYNHEYRHYKFYISAEYQKKCVKSWNALSQKQRDCVEKWLSNFGYSPSVFIDEFQAYSTTEGGVLFGVPQRKEFDEIIAVLI